MDSVFSPYDIGDDVEFYSEALTIEQELEKFRKQWRQELVQEREREESPERGAREAPYRVGEEHQGAAEQPSIEDEAKYLFLQGVGAEQRGHLADAIRYYRKAVQLVPDIEFKIDDFRPQRERKERTISECSVESTGTLAEEEEEDLSDLLHHFHRLRVADGPLCSAEFGRVGVSFASLPAEVLNYILKWLVSSDLDVLALENMSQVCRGFYVASRDEGLWRLICQRIWGRNCGDASNYGSYRNMYYQREHLRFNGCYISKTVYYRQGESSFCSFYRPFHMVEYYRYVRFYPEGHVIMLTTAEDPYDVVQKLKNKNCKCQGLLYGRYRVVGNVVSAVMKRRYVDYTQGIYSRYRRKAKNEVPETEQTFHLDFLMGNAGSRPQSKLVWKHYARHCKNRLTGEETMSEFDLSINDYPPLIFSRVKSYTMVADKPLT